MNLNQLKAFYSVIKTGTFSKAADELCVVTQPAVFIQVRSLERQLGFTLLDRFGKELRPAELAGFSLGTPKKYSPSSTRHPMQSKNFRNSRKAP